MDRLVLEKHGHMCIRDSTGLTFFIDSQSQYGCNRQGMLAMMMPGKCTTAVFIALSMVLVHVIYLFHFQDKSYSGSPQVTIKMIKKPILYENANYVEDEKSHKLYEENYRVVDNLQQLPDVDINQWNSITTTIAPMQTNLINIQHDDVPTKISTRSLSEDVYDVTPKPELSDGTTTTHIDDVLTVASEDVAKVTALDDVTKGSTLDDVIEGTILDGVTKGTTRDDVLSMLNDDEVTIVTAYIDIGTFSKGSVTQKQGTSQYLHWLTVFKSLTNPVVAYFDNQSHIEYFNELRQDYTNRTQVHKIDLNSTWPFQHREKVLEIIHQKDYPIYYPNTVIPEYSLIMHMKYQLVNQVASTNPFGTKYIAWLDIGLFRSMANRVKIPPYHIHPPPGFQQDKIAYNLVGSFKNHTTEEIFLRNEFTVCGCFFIGQIPRMIEWTQGYKNAVETFFDMNLSNTDQQVLYAWMSNSTDVMDRVQLYKPRPGYSRWFSLGYICKEALEMRTS